MLGIRRKRVLNSAVIFLSSLFYGSILCQFIICLLFAAAFVCVLDRCFALRLSCFSKSGCSLPLILPRVPKFLREVSLHFMEQNSCFSSQSFHIVRLSSHQYFSLYLMSVFPSLNERSRVAPGLSVPEAYIKAS